MVIEIDGLTQAQELAIHDLLSMFASLSENKASRWISFYVDGAGDFRPQIKVNDGPPMRCAITGAEQQWVHVYFRQDQNTFLPEPMYLIDSCSIEEVISKNDSDGNSP